MPLTHTHKSLSRKKSQSAMEYLMTYGWAILIIAVVLGVLFQLGVFSGSALAPKAQPGSCQVQRLLGQVSLEGLCQGQLPQFVAFFPTSSTDNVLATIPATLSPTQGTVTIWINKVFPTNDGAVHGTLGIGGFPGAFSSASDFNAIQIFKYSNNLWYFRAWEPTGGDCDVQIADSAVNGNAWHQFTLEWGSAVGGVKVWLDGNTPVQCSQANGPPTFESQTLYIGEGYQLTSAGAYLANLQIYNTTLSSSEVDALYLGGIGGAPIKLQNLVGWWPLNGNGNDYSGNNHNGQINGGVSFNSTWNSQYTPP